MLNQFSRTELLFGKEAMDILENSRVAVFGVGGVGGYTVEALVRSGVEDSISKITNMVKNVNVDSIKSHINTAQKAIDFVSDLTKKNPTSNIAENLTKGPVSPRPLNKFFED